jgi:hypothetical protein
MEPYITGRGLKKYVGERISMRVPGGSPQIYQGKLKLKKSGAFFVGRNELKTGHRVGIDMPSSTGEEYARFYDVKLD